jgi:hypothetical protein
MGTTPNPAPAAAPLDIYDPANPDFVNPNDVLAKNPNDTAAAVASTNVDVIVATSLRSVQAQIGPLNANLKTVYLNTWAPWLYGWQNGRITDKGTAPVPPGGYVVGYMLAGGAEWPYPMQGNVPVCAQPPIPTILKAQPPVDPNAPPPGDLGYKVNAIDPAIDGWPVGVAGRATRADGSVWEKFAFHTPFGSGWYGECVVEATS